MTQLIESAAIAALAALAQATRLRLFRALVAAGPQGRVVGELAVAVEAAPATLSFHLKALAQAGLVEAQSEGRFIRYRAHYATMNALLGYLSENCCGGQACGVSAVACMPEEKC